MGANRRGVASQFRVLGGRLHSAVLSTALRTGSIRPRLDVAKGTKLVFNAAGTRPSMIRGWRADEDMDGKTEFQTWMEMEKGLAPSVFALGIWRSPAKLR